MVCMLLLHDRLINVPILSIQTGGRLGRVAKVIIDPRQLRIVAFYCEGPMLDSHPAILHTEDIREVTANSLIVDSAESIMATDDLVRLKEVLNFNFGLKDKPVIDDTGTKLGKVATFSVETTTFYIVKLHVRPNFWQALQTTERIIDRTQVIEITPKRITVQSATVKEGLATSSVPTVDNPFRKHTPQPDTATPKSK